MPREKKRPLPAEPENGLSTRDDSKHKPIITYSDAADEEILLDLIDNAPAADVASVLHGHWVYSVKANGSGSYSVNATCSECGWHWFSDDGVGNAHAVFGAFITNYKGNEKEGDWFLLYNARKRNKFTHCPICGAKLDGEDGTE